MRKLGGENRGRGGGELNEAIRYAEVRGVIRGLKNGKTTRMDEIVNEVLKYGGSRSQ